MQLWIVSGKSSELFTFTFHSQFKHRKGQLNVFVNAAVCFNLYTCNEDKLTLVFCNQRTQVTLQHGSTWNWRGSYWRLVHLLLVNAAMCCNLYKCTDGEHTLVFCNCRTQSIPLPDTFPPNTIQYNYEPKDFVVAFQNNTIQLSTQSFCSCSLQQLSSLSNYNLLKLWVLSGQKQWNEKTPVQSWPAFPPCSPMLITVESSARLKKCFQQSWICFQDGQ